MNLSPPDTIDSQNFKLAVDNASDHIIITDPEGIILYANKAVETITGFSPQEVVGKKAGSKELWGGQMPIEFYKKLWHTIKEEKKPFFGFIKNKRKNSQIYTAETHIAPVFDKHGQIVSFVGIERDVTKAQEIDRMKTEFISLASHQLRTPLSAIKWFLEMLESGEAGLLNQKQQEFVTNINQSNERMIALVNSLLNVSRIESGRLTIEPKEVNLPDLINTVVTEATPTLTAKKIHLTLLVDPNIHTLVLDPKLIYEIYKNLLSNAIKYTQSGGNIKLNVSIKGQEVVSEVSDTGVGIPASEQYKLFTKFYRGTNVLKLETEGTGLGLYLVKIILDSCGGRIKIKSQENIGTTVWFSLPVTGMTAKVGEIGYDSKYNAKV